MARSMTGYGRADCLFNDKHITVEIKSINGKTLDITFKMPVMYREKEPELRAELSRIAQRGKVDIFITPEAQSDKAVPEFNAALFKAYFVQLEDLMTELDIPADKCSIVEAVLHVPEILKQPPEELSQEEWDVVSLCVKQAIHLFDTFRRNEGTTIMQDILQRITLIENLLEQVDEYDPQRIDTVKQRLYANLETLRTGDYDKNRFEQELIYYIEKLDITEEKIRLKQHCTYFRETSCEETSGRKLGFIAQEIGREINTLGAKANHAGMQKTVIRMKDELEKIKEQLLNVL